MRPVKMHRFSVLVVLVLMAAVVFTGLSAAPLPTAAQAESDVAAQNLKLAQRVIDELWNGKNFDATDELYSLNDTWHRPNSPQSTVVSYMPGTWRTVFAMLHKAYPDMTVTITHMAAIGNAVMIHYAGKGTHKEPVYTPNTLLLPPSGKEEIWDGVFIFRFKDSKIVEEWWYWNNDAIIRAEYGIK